MKYVRIQNIDDPYFYKMHQLMKLVFPPEEVLAYPLWKEPLEDPGIRVFVAVNDEDEVVGATEYRYYEDFNVAMTDFTIIGQERGGIGSYLAEHRLADLQRLAEDAGVALGGMFAEIYDPYRVSELPFGGIRTMDPYVRREVLSHLGYRKIDFDYVHPSWNNDGEAVEGLDLCFMPLASSKETISAELVVQFLTRYYAVLSNKPQRWLDMVAGLKQHSQLALSRI